ncbi:hypothetical protein [Lentilactobacillus sp. Marseille-Q4993]|uniref:hypothetical protein n=1 Tax=Lentilactobacillus sp. Marseille-Q4993 TaxID=3039492 RepID=UPI0024BC488B|nr:hypothetical protein [Lentilactobacillus sp. Marseille-Q4993]
MIKKLLKGTALIATVFGLLATTNLTTQAAKSQTSNNSYQVVSKKWLRSGTYTPYHTTSTTKNIYLWNGTHTKKRANLKNYKGYSWIKKINVTLRHNGKNYLYYYVDAYRDTKTYKNVSGLVYSGSVKAGLNPSFSGTFPIDVNYFKSLSEYNSYIKKSKSQSLTRGILKLFPNTKVSLELSQNAVFFSPTTSIQSRYSEILRPRHVDDFLNNGKGDKMTTAQRVAAIKQALADDGYTTNKLKDLSGYELGIYLTNYQSRASQNDDPIQGIILGKLK